MKIFIYDSAKLIKYAAAVAAAILAVIFFCLGGGKAVGVFNAEKELPIYSVDTAGKKASITFDCAWGDDDIPNILQSLEKADVKATFFIVGQWAEKYPDKVSMISAAGHDVANHSYSHLRMGSLDKSRIMDEIVKANKLLEKITGTKIDLFRPPYGDYNNSVVLSARELGYYTIQWNVDSLDWKPDISRETIMSRIRDKVIPGSIILFHNDTQHTAKMLPDVISTLKGMGYEMVPVSQLIIRENYIIDNEGRQKNAGGPPTNKN